MQIRCTKKLLDQLNVKQGTEMLRKIRRHGSNNWPQIKGGQLLRI